MPHNKKPTWKEIKQNPYVGRATEAVKFWWGDNPKDIATEMVKDALLFGTARKVYKVGKKGLSESKTVQDLIKKSNQHGDAIIKTVQSKWSKMSGKTVKPKQFTQKELDYYNKEFDKFQYGHSTDVMGTPADKKKFEKLQRWMRDRQEEHGLWERSVSKPELAPTPTRLKPQGKPNIIKTQTPKPSITITMKKPYKQPKKRRKTNVELGKRRSKKGR